MTDAAKKGGPPFRLVTWNIRKALGTDRRRDPERIMQVLSGLSADVALLQEADFRLPPRPPVMAPGRIEAATGLTPAAFPHGRTSLGWHGNALLTGPGVTVETVAQHDLPGMEPRGYVEAVLCKAGVRLRVLGVHLGLLRVSRRAQLSAILAHLAKTDPLPVMIAGDFNERSDKVGLGRLAKGYRILSGGPTWHARHPLFALDRIVTSREITPVAVTALRTGVTALASDHLPLMADLLLPAEAPPSSRG